MAAIREILGNKGDKVFSIAPRSSALGAAILMNQHKVGSLLVIDEGNVVGIITERDLLQRVMAECKDASATPVADVMTVEVLCCQPDTSIEEAKTAMKDRRIRHLPVVDDDGQLHGLISIGDLNAYEAHSQEVTIHVMTEYIHGRT